MNAIMARTDPVARVAAASLLELALGEIALAEGRTSDALDAFRRSDLAEHFNALGYCRACILPRLARAADRAGSADSARILWNRYVTTSSMARQTTDQWFLAMAYRRLGELPAVAGDRAKAAEYDRRLIALWQDADAELQPQVSSSRRRLAQLQR
jgi:hypothetical protein